jgi:hypothetical protein
LSKVIAHFLEMTKNVCLLFYLVDAIFRASEIVQRLNGQMEKGWVVVKMSVDHEGIELSVKVVHLRLGKEPCSVCFSMSQCFRTKVKARSLLF